MRVSAYVMDSRAGSTINACAACLHDVVEDCYANTEHNIIKNHNFPDNLFESFLTKNPRIPSEVGKEIFKRVMLLTHSWKLSKKDKKVDSYTRIKECGIPDVAVIKFCDRLDNLISIPYCFTPDGQKYYVEDTNMMIDYLGTIVANRDIEIYNKLMLTLKEIKNICGIEG